MSYLERSKWLKNLKVGDEVYVQYFSTYKSSKVKRLTNTLVILEDDRRFRKSDGFALGNNSWSTLSIVEPTESLKDKLKKENLIRYIQSLKSFDDLSTNDLQKIYDIMMKGKDDDQL